jgi:hypothetical protein
MAKNAKNKLPQTLYVRWDYPNNGEPWLTVNETAEDSLETATDEKIVGVYELKKKLLVKSTVSVSVSEKA